MASQKKKKRSYDILTLLILLIALAVFCYSGWRLYTIQRNYSAADGEYASLADEFTTPSKGGGSSGAADSQGGDGGAGGSAAASSAESGDTTGVQHYIEDAEPPVDVDWEYLKAINPEIVGWLYVDAKDNINYPICRGEDNDFYLHHTFRGDYLFAGSIFEECMNSPDFSDPNTIVYGHNMRNGSMFAGLKQLKSADVLNKSPYFWILTPDGNYRYHIICVMDTPVNSEVYTLFPGKGPAFLEWEKNLQKNSYVENEVPLAEDDFVVTLSTCTSDSDVRCVVIGKCVSSTRPPERTATVTPDTASGAEGSDASANGAAAAGGEAAGEGGQEEGTGAAGDGSGMQEDPYNGEAGADPSEITDEAP